MPRQNLRAASALVRPLCKELGLPYHSPTFPMVRATAFLCIVVWCCGLQGMWGGWQSGPCGSMGHRWVNRMMHSIHGVFAHLSAQHKSAFNCCMSVYACIFLLAGDSGAAELLAPHCHASKKRPEGHGQPQQLTWQLLQRMDVQNKAAVQRMTSN